MGNRFIQIHLAAALLFVLVGCLDNSKNSSSADSSSTNVADSDTTLASSSFSMKYKNSRSADNDNNANLNESPLPLVFGMIGVNGWNYRPGAGPASAYDKNHKKVNNIESNDWSMWDMLPIGGVATNFVLPSGQSMDIKQLSGAHWHDKITGEFAKNVGHFRFDFIMIGGSPNVVTSNNTICGPNYFYGTPDQWPAAFPNLTVFAPGSPADYSSPRCFKVPLYNSEPIGGYDYTFAIMARKDWFPNPVTLKIRIANTGRVNCYTSNVALNNFQTEIIDSLMEQKHGKAGGGIDVNWPAGLYNSQGCPFNPSAGGSVPTVVTISPFADKIPVVKFSAEEIPQEPIQTPMGHNFPTPRQYIISSNLEATLNFNLYPSNISNWADVNNPAYHFLVCPGGGGCSNPDGSFSYGFSPNGLLWYGFHYINILPSQNGAPWGLSIDFEKKN